MSFHLRGHDYVSISRRGFHVDCRAVCGPTSQPHRRGGESNGAIALNKGSFAKSNERVNKGTQDFIN